MRTFIWFGLFVVLFFPPSAQCETDILTREKAEMMGRVEDFFLHNFRDVTWRKSLEWGDVTTLDDGSHSIRYTYEAQIWDKDHMVMSQEFTFAPEGIFVRYENAPGYPKKKAEKKADVTTREGMIELVNDFFSKNYRDITARKSLEWGQPIKDDKGNTSIAYECEATIRDKEKTVMHQVFTFDPNGTFVSVKEVKAEPAKPQGH